MLLPNGKVLVAGADNSDSSLASAELYGRHTPQIKRRGLVVSTTPPEALFRPCRQLSPPSSTRSPPRFRVTALCRLNWTPTITSPRGIVQRIGLGEIVRRDCEAQT